ncbi:MAG: DNA alkylation repair protein [Candidatus Saccharimonadales bacterium]|jgi:3-methyladenine DNA glycosylase AlkD
MTAEDVVSEMQKYASDADAVNLQWFFKTGPGEYGEGDQFIGVRVPMIRRVCKEFRQLPLAEVEKLIESPFHEHRMAGLIILSLQYPKANEHGKRAIYDLYIDELAKGNINNWDLIDVTCKLIVGPELRNDRSKLFELARSNSLWERRVAMISTFAYLKQPAVETTADMLEIAEILLYDSHDLIQKAVGWALREIGHYIDRQLLLDFLDRHAHDMPRTALRYAIEHLSETDRQHYMKLRILKG